MQKLDGQIMIRFRRADELIRDTAVYNNATNFLMLFSAIFAALILFIFKWPSTIRLDFLFGVFVVVLVLLFWGLSLLRKLLGRLNFTWKKITPDVLVEPAVVKLDEMLFHKLYLLYARISENETGIRDRDSKSLAGNIVAVLDEITSKLGESTFESDVARRRFYEVLRSLFKTRILPELGKAEGVNYREIALLLMNILSFLAKDDLTVTDLQGAERNSRLMRVVVRKQNLADYLITTINSSKSIRFFAVGSSLLILFIMAGWKETELMPLLGLSKEAYYGSLGLISLIVLGYIQSD